MVESMLIAVEPASDKGLRDFDVVGRRLDDSLRELSRQEALCRRVLGKLAGAFLKLSGHHGLGFARLGDYARERLGLSAREIQTLASVSTGLDRFPLLARAFEASEISWTQVRILVAVADEESEGRWLSLARGKTVRALAAAIREARGRSGRDEIGEEEGRTIDGELALPFRMVCGRKVKQLWREVVALARQTAGEELPLWRAADLIAAEGWSSFAGRVDGDAGSETSPDRSPVVARTDAAPESENAVDAFPFVAWDALEAAIARDLVELGREIDRLDPFELDRRMREVLSALQSIDWRVGRLLRMLCDLRLHRALGFASFDRYVDERLALSPRKARALVSLERRSGTVPEIASAYRDGKISWCRMLALLPVLGSAHGAEWARRACEVTAVRLNAEVEWATEKCETEGALMLVAPPPIGGRLTPPGRQLGARLEIDRRDVEVAFSGPMSVIFSFRAAVRQFSEAGERMDQGLERLLSHVKEQWEGVPRHRDPIFERDGWRCLVPACTSRRNLHDHHREFRSRGGGNERENRLSVCAWHHLRGIHQNRVRVTGQAPDHLRWEIGVRAGAEPLIRLEGDRYVT